MGTFSGAALINELATRLRDPTNTGYPRAMLLDLVNRIQDAVNVRLGLVYKEVTFVTTDTALYATATIASDYAYPAQMFDGDHREIDLVRYERLTQQDEGWLRLHAKRPEIFAPIGRELLAITPIPDVPMTMTLRYVKHPTALADAGTPLWDLPDEHVELVLDLAEAVASLRGRNFNAVKESLSRAAEKLGLEDMTQIMQRGVAGDQVVSAPPPGK